MTKTVRRLALQGSVAAAAALIIGMVPVHSTPTTAGADVKLSSVTGAIIQGTQIDDQNLALRVSAQDAKPQIIHIWPDPHAAVQVAARDTAPQIIHIWPDPRHTN